MGAGLHERRLMSGIVQIGAQRGAEGRAGKALAKLDDGAPRALSSAGLAVCIIDLKFRAQSI